MLKAEALINQVIHGVYVTLTPKHLMNVFIALVQRKSKWIPCSRVCCSDALLLSHFSRVRLCVTPYTAAHQAPPTLGFSRQEHWSGLPFPSPVQMLSCVQLCDPMDCSLPCSSVHEISQVRILEWVAISFSRASSHPRDWTHVSCIDRQILYHCATGVIT